MPLRSIATVVVEVVGDEVQQGFEFVILPVLDRRWLLCVTAYGASDSCVLQVVGPVRQE